MKAFLLAIALTLFSVSLPAASKPDARSLWLRGDWKSAEARLQRDEATARRAGDRSGELLVMRDRVLFLLDRNSYSKHDPGSVRAAVDSFYEAALRSSDAGIQADAIHAMGRYRYWQMFSGEGDWKTVGDLFARALALREAAGSSSGVAESHFYLGLVHQVQDEAAPARALFERGLALAGHDPLMQSFLERHLGALDEEAGNNELAHRRYIASVDLRRQAGATLLVPFALNLLASHEETARHNVKRATELYRESAVLARKTHSNRALANAEGELARLAASRGDQRAARRHAKRSLDAAKSHGDPELVGEATELEKRFR